MKQKSPYQIGTPYGGDLIRAFLRHVRGERILFFN